MLTDKHTTEILILLSIILLSIPSISHAYEIKPQEIEHLEGTLQFKGQIYSPLKIDELNYSYYGIPDNYYGLKTSSDYTVGKDRYGNKKLILNFDDIMEREINVEMDFESNSKFDLPKNIGYPYDPPKDVMKYLEEGNKTMITEEIRETSRKLIEGSKSSFEVVSKLTRWVNTNLVYDESYGNTAKSSKWVLKNKRGTCDEFSTLLISMLRSSGIPSRYVAGAVYSKGGWGYHGWVEVYLGKWTPVDPTWNEVGWIDATHLPFGRFRDPDEVDVGIEYKSFRNIGSSIRFKAPDVDVMVKDRTKGNKILDLETSSYPKKIAPGKSTVIEIIFKKENEGCIFTTAHVMSRLMKNGKVSFEKKEIPIDLCNKTKKKYVKLSPGNLNKNFIYKNIGDIKTPLSDAETLDLEINPKVELEKTKVMVGENIKINIISDKKYRVFSNLDIRDEQIKTKEPGKYEIIVATETGETRVKNLTVVKNLDFQTKNISFPEKLTCGNSTTISIELENLGQEAVFPIVFNTKKDVTIESRNITLRRGETKKIRTTMATEKDCLSGERIIHFRISDRYYNQKIKLEEKRGNKRETGGLLEIFSSFFTRIQEFFSKPFEL
ncbi:MAG: transglutaminase family protein [Candidatus Aenigmatarchaeota archaeon]